MIFESPFNMLCDSPSNYMREPECTEFIASVPTTWDETVGLDGRVGEYVSIARRKGDTWYVGGMTDWNARTLTIDLGFLGEGAYTAELFRDGVNADKAARDYKRESVEIPADRKLTVKMAPGGGFALKITRKERAATHTKNPGGLDGPPGFRFGKRVAPRHSCVKTAV